MDTNVVNLFRRGIERKPIITDKVEDMTPQADYKKLSESLGITLEEAEEMVDKFYLAYPAAIEWARLKISPNFRKGK